MHQALLLNTAHDMSHYHTPQWREIETRYGIDYTNEEWRTHPDIIAFVQAQHDAALANPNDETLHHWFNFTIQQVRTDIPWQIEDYDNAEYVVYPTQNITK